MNTRLLHGDCLDVLATLPAESVDACVTDPPYGIGFMGKEWDTFKPGQVLQPERYEEPIVSDNPNLHGRRRSPAVSPSQIPYDYSAKGLREFQAWTEAWAREVLRTLKPGGHAVVCGAPRAYHRMACGLEDAGFEIRDCLAWLFLSGFPKSLNFGCKCGGNALPSDHDDSESAAEYDLRSVLCADVSTAVHAGDESRQVLFNGLPEQSASERGAARAESEISRGEQPSLERRQLHRAGEGLSDDSNAGPPTSADERLRAGAHRGRGADAGTPTQGRRGSASRGPRSSKQRALEPEGVRLPQGTLGDGASRRGARCERCGGLTEAAGQGSALKPCYEPIALARKPFKGSLTNNYIKHGVGGLNILACRIGDAVVGWGGGANTNSYGGFTEDDDSDPRHVRGRWPANVVLGLGIKPDFEPYFYTPKPSREERDYGCHHLPRKSAGDCTDRTDGSAGLNNPRAGAGRTGGGRNFHPTVKPVELMRWLVKLVTPVGGTVLDPFMGSGTTGMACRYEQRGFIGIEREAEYLTIAQARIAAVAPMFAQAEAEPA